jgi:hypothetical protein
MDRQEGDKRVFFTNEEWDRLAMYLIGNNTRYRENIIIPRMMGPVKIKTKEEKMVEAAIESCAFKTVTSCVLGKWQFIQFVHSCVNKYLPQQKIIKYSKIAVIPMFVRVFCLYQHSYYDMFRILGSYY